MTARAPVLFLSHGSPMTAVTPGVLGEVWAGLATELGKPAAVLVVSAHWNTRLLMLTGGKNPPTLYDFTGFAAELYRLNYPALGQPELAESVRVIKGSR